MEVEQTVPPQVTLSFQTGHIPLLRKVSKSRMYLYSALDEMAVRPLYLPLGQPLTLANYWPQVYTALLWSKAG